MSVIDLDQLSPQNLIAQYVIECRGQGHFLPYTDHAVIDEWLGLAADADDLLVVLSEILPEFYAKVQKGGKPRPLQGARKLVLARLRERKMKEIP